MMKKLRLRLRLVGDHSHPQRQDRVVLQRVCLISKFALKKECTFFLYRLSLPSKSFIYVAFQERSEMLKLMQKSMGNCLHISSTKLFQRAASTFSIHSANGVREGACFLTNLSIGRRFLINILLSSTNILSQNAISGKQFIAKRD
jgi:hypothetical protein